MNKIILYIFYLCIFFYTHAYAYLDPGTGSIIIQALVATIALGLGFLSYWWKKIKEKIKKLISFFKKKNKS